MSYISTIKAAPDFEESLIASIEKHVYKIAGSFLTIVVGSRLGQKLASEYFNPYYEIGSTFYQQKALKNKNTSQISYLVDLFKNYEKININDLQSCIKGENKERLIEIRKAIKNYKKTETTLDDFYNQLKKNDPEFFKYLTNLNISQKDHAQ